MTVLDLIHELDNLPPNIKCLPVFRADLSGLDYPIASGQLFAPLEGHEQVVDRPERFVLS